MSSTCDGRGGGGRLLPLLLPPLQLQHGGRHSCAADVPRAEDHFVVVAAVDLPNHDDFAAVAEHANYGAADVVVVGAVGAAGDFVVVAAVDVVGAGGACLSSNHHRHFHSSCPLLRRRVLPLRRKTQRRALGPSSDCAKRKVACA